jgi:PPOX class probable F420-dependent enzyme
MCIARCGETCLRRASAWGGGSSSRVSDRLSVPEWFVARPALSREGREAFGSAQAGCESATFSMEYDMAMATDHETLDRLNAGKYLLVTTFRRDGRSVSTPVWVIRDGDSLGVWTVADSGKVKRIRNRPEVLVSACDFRGKPAGDQIKGFAEIIGEEETSRYRSLLASKYGLFAWLTLSTSGIRRGKFGTVAIRITLV